jgi:transcriptional regulator with XRE-family HTH domain
VQQRQTLNVSQRALAHELGCSPSALWRLEHLVRADAISFVDVAATASLLGLELSATLRTLGEPIRDRGHQALLARFRQLLHETISVIAEAPLPSLGDRRSWDPLLRIAAQLIGVEAETRIRDEQHLVRRIRERERDGGTDEVLLVLAESAVNRRLLPGLLESLGPRFATPSRLTRRALREGRPLAGSGVIVV